MSRRSRGAAALGVVVAALALTLVAASPASAAGLPPVAVADSFRTTVGVPKVVGHRGVLRNDRDPEGDRMTAVLQYQPFGGTVVLQPNGEFVYTPSPGFEGSDSFGYAAYDGTTASPVVSVAILVNGPPVATDDTYGSLDGSIRVPAPGVLGNDVDNSVFTPVRTILRSGPAHGRLGLRRDGSFWYLASPGFTGTDSFTYTVTDGELTSAPATVELVLRTGNGAPTAEDDTFELAEDNLLDVAAPGLTENDTDPEGDTLTAELVQPPFFGDLDFRTDGSFSWQPPENFDSDVTFTYRVFDGFDWSEPATVLIDMFAVDDPPVAEDDAYEGEQGQPITVPAPGVLTNDSDPVEGDALSVTGVLSGPGNGTVVLGADGGFVYTPEADFVGFDSFSYGLRDSGGAGAAGFVSITVNEGPPHDPGGTIDAVTRGAPGEVHVVGWAIDIDSTDPIDVTISVDGVDAATVTADADRPDVGVFFPGYGNDLGFDTTIPLDDGEHEVCVLARNVGVGVDTSIGCVTVPVAVVDA